MKKKMVSIVLIIAMTCIFAGCGSDSLMEVNLLGDVFNEQTSENPKEEPENRQEIVNQMNVFAFHLYEAMEEEGNQMISPYSVNMALSMVLNGAEGQTKEEIMNALGISDMNEWNAMNEYLAHEPQQEETKIALANSIWASENANFSPDMQDLFVKPLEEQYNTEFIRCNFEDENTLKEINDWVSDKTEGMIDPFLDSINPNIKMCIINSIYFEGEWESKFEEQNTFEAPFYGTIGEQNVQTMHQYGEYFRYIEESNGLIGIELPYGKGDYCMDILVAGEESSASTKELLEEMTTEEKLALLTKLGESEKTCIQTFALPKFEFETELMDVVKPLRDLGVNNAFDGSTAEFPMIGQNIYIESFFHKSMIVVDENGTKAAAATAVMMNDGAALIEKETNVIVDKPFFFCIRDTKNGEILFMGEQCKF